MDQKFFECYICRKNFKSRESNLLRHLNLHGPILKRYKCQACRKSFQNKQKYHRHWTDKHTTISIKPNKPKIIERQVKGMWKYLLLITNQSFLALKIQKFKTSTYLHTWPFLFTNITYRPTTWLFIKQVRFIYFDFSKFHLQYCTHFWSKFRIRASIYRQI